MRNWKRRVIGLAPFLCAMNVAIKKVYWTLPSLSHTSVMMVSFCGNFSLISTHKMTKRKCSRVCTFLPFALFVLLRFFTHFVSFHHSDALFSQENLQTDRTSNEMIKWHESYFEKMISLLNDVSSFNYSLSFAK